MCAHYNVIIELWLRAYYDYGYGRTTTMATGVLRLRLRAYYCYGYGRSTATATGVLRLWLRAYYDYGYGRTTTEATGELRQLFYCVYRTVKWSSCSLGIGTHPVWTLCVHPSYGSLDRRHDSNLVYHLNLFTVIATLSV